MLILYGHRLLLIYQFLAVCSSSRFFCTFLIFFLNLLAIPLVFYFWWFFLDSAAIVFARTALSSDFPASSFLQSIVMYFFNPRSYLGKSPGGSFFSSALWLFVSQWSFQAVSSLPVLTGSASFNSVQVDVRVCVILSVLERWTAAYRCLGTLFVLG